MGNSPGHFGVFRKQLRKNAFSRVQCWLYGNVPLTGTGCFDKMVEAGLAASFCVFSPTQFSSACGPQDMSCGFLLSNLRRLERYLIMAWDSGGQPVVVLTKRDLAVDAKAGLEEVEAIAAGVPVLAISAVTGEGMEGLDSWLVPGKTLVVLGSSGVGKSTLMNRLAGRELALTKEVREGDAHGRHTTTHRELFLLDSGVLMLDTPGIRELQLWETDMGLDDTFEDIRMLTEGCRFRDCKHLKEPGCAVLGALREGMLDGKRYESYHKLERELRFMSSKNSHAARMADRQFGKAISKMMKERAKP